MATLTNIPKHAASLTNVAISKQLTGGGPFYAWLFWFTASAMTLPPLTNVPKHSASLINIAKS